MVRNHVWNKDDTIINLYFVKYELKGLPIRDVKELAECVIGSSVASLNMQSANIRFVLGEDVKVLDCFSKVQEQVVNDYNKLPQDQLKELVIDIILKRDTEENIRIVRQKKAEKDKKDKLKQQQIDLEQMWIKKGKDPKKMHKIC